MVQEQAVCNPVADEEGRGSEEGPLAQATGPRQTGPPLLGGVPSLSQVGWPGTGLAVLRRIHKGWSLRVNR